MFNNIKRLITGTILVLFLCAACHACSLQESNSPVLFVNAFGGGKQSCGTIKTWEKKENELVLFLPSGIDFSTLRFWCEPVGKVLVNDEAIIGGESCPAITADGTYSLTCNGEVCQLTVISSQDVPVVFIETDSGSLDAIHSDKTYKENGRMNVYENGVLTVGVALDYIKGRGNQTWTGEKRPYNIKCAESISLLGMDEAKKWCLLANVPDETLIRNTVALTLAQRMEIPYACDCRAADVYINGEYRGSYLITEKVDVSDSVVNITDLEDLNEIANPGVEIGSLEILSTSGESERGSKRWTDIPSSPDDVSGGYLLEFDRAYYDYAKNGFCTEHGQYIAVKSPSNISKEEIDYISHFCDEAEEALCADDGYNSLGRHYSEYYDVPSLAKVFVLNEYLLNSDVSFSSNFLSKDRNGKLTAGPVWDFDSCLLAEQAYPPWYFSVETWCTNLLCVCRSEEEATLFALAFRHKDFREEAARQWMKYRDVIAGDAFAGLVDDIAGALSHSVVLDHLRWGISGTVSVEQWTEIYLEKCRKLSELAAKRVGYLEKGLLGNAAMLYYDFNGVNGWIFSEKIAVEGESVTVKALDESTYDLNDCVLKEWNTAPDGSGKAYMPGDSIVLTGPSMVLYAQWTTKE